MPFEYTESTTKSTLIMYRLPNGELKYSGMFRLTFADGTTTLRLTPSFDNTRVFNDIQVVEPPGGDASELALTNFGANYGVAVV